MSDTSFEKFKKVYFIGIGGIGMSAIARMFLLEGKEVFGSDLSASEVTDELQKLGAQINIGEPKPVNGENFLPEGIDLVIYTVAIPETQPQLREARSRTESDGSNVPVFTYPEALGILSKNKFTIAVAGTHGKTTTTAMVAKILIDAGLDPTVIVGSFLKDQKSNFVAGKSKYFIVEACEYKRSFLNLHPDISIITNIDDDHLDYYKNMEGIQQGFTEFLGLVKNGGTVVTDSTHKNIAPVVRSVESQTDRKVELIDYNQIEDSVSLKIPGQHNIQNAKAALVVAEIVGVAKDVALKALSNFSGTWRRFDYHGVAKSGVELYDDYAHHPSEISATLQAAREKFPKNSNNPNRKIVIAFQPHLYSRTKEHLEEFAPAFSGADEILLLPIYAAREPKDPNISSELVVEKMKAAGLNAQFFPTFESAANYLNTDLKSGDVFFTMGAGDVSKIIDIIEK